MPASVEYGKPQVVPDVGQTMVRLDFSSPANGITIMAPEGADVLVDVASLDGSAPLESSWTVPAGTRQNFDVSNLVKISISVSEGTHSVAVWAV